MTADITVVAAIALLAWPLVTAVLFSLLGAGRGLIWSVLLGYLFLPERVGFDLPLLPPYTKYTAIVYALLLAAPLANRRAPTDDFRTAEVADQGFRAILIGMIGLFMLAPALTFLFNRSPVVMEGAWLPGLGISDFLVMFMEVFVVVVPFLLARRWLASPEHHTRLLWAIVLLAVFYSFLALFELRMSPQLNKWTYGYFPHLWLQHLRGNGFRPLVFLDHGLSLGFFLFTASIAVVALLLQAKGERMAMLILSAIMIVGTLLVSRNLGAVMLLVIFLPVLFFKTGLQIRIAALVGLLFLCYPLLRHQAPIEEFTEIVGTYSADRAHSLNYRLQNETELLERAWERPAFGWGIWGRAQLYNENGVQVSVTDGTWIIVIGELGWVGFLSYFGVITLPLFFLARAARRKPIPLSVCALALITAGNLVYLIPNSTITPLSWVIFGALAGFCERDLKATNDAPEEEKKEPERQVRYTRFNPGMPSTSFAQKASMPNRRT